MTYVTIVLTSRYPVLKHFTDVTPEGFFGIRETVTELTGRYLLYAGGGGR